jgi:hypothetical protein
MVAVVGTARERGSEYECVRVISFMTEADLKPVGPFIAFASPIDKQYPKKRTTTPDRPLQDVIEYFREEGVQLVVRLNEKLYDGAVFEEQGMKHVEMVRHFSPFPDFFRLWKSKYSTFQTDRTRRRNTSGTLSALWKGCGAL